jgi:hypothetical protein
MAKTRCSDSYEPGNQRAAALILEDPTRYGAGMTAWARLVAARHSTMPETAPARPTPAGRAAMGQLPLFPEANHAS